MNTPAAEHGDSQLRIAAACTELDVSEVYLLVLHWLSNGPCKKAAAALLQEVAQQGLLPQQHDVLGGTRSASYESLLQQHNRVPADALQQLLQQCLARVQASDHAGSEGLQSLLAAGPLASLPSLAAAHKPQIPQWMRHPATHAALPQLQLLQQTGLARASNSNSSRRLPLQYTADQFCHHATFRGHGFPVFSLIFDKDGRRIVTGADDAIIKIWSLETGLLLVTGRGHTGEISDLSLSADGSMVASGSVDCDVRVWSMLPQNLGQNTAVLRGHTAPITLIKFHPTNTAALISASADGSLRLWDAKDQHFASLLLLPSPNFGAFGSSMRLGLPAAAGAGGPRRSFTGVVAAAAVPPPPAAAVAAAAAAAEGETGDGSSEHAMLCCSWSPDGKFIVAGSQDCGVYIWHWNATQQLQQQHENGPKRRSSSGGAAAASQAVSATTQSPVSVDMQPATGQQQMQQNQQQPNRLMRRRSQAQAEQGDQQQQQQQQHLLPQRRLSSGAAAAAAGDNAAIPGTPVVSAVQEQQDQQQRGRITRRRSQAQAEQALQDQDDQPQRQQQQRQVSASESAVAAMFEDTGIQQQQQQQLQHLDGFFPSADWPVPAELQNLNGHKNEVIQAEFSHGGSRLATASLDGSVRVWQLIHGAKGKPKLFWQEALPPLMVVAVSDPTAAARARQRREQAQALVINHIAWAADDSKILASASDNIIRVWCAHTGTLLQLLKGHSQQAHVLETHPYDARLALSAGYDGQTYLWDITTGVALKTFSSSDTIPLARGSWAPPVIQLCDGHFSPDGNAICIADVAGQFSYYAVGSPTPLLLSGPHDQFFKKDYDPIMHDEAGFAAYMDPPVPCYHLKGQQPLCDNQFMPYADEFQLAYREGRVLEFVRSGGAGMSLRGTCMTLPSSLQLWPPTVTAAVWKALEDRAALIAKGSSRIVSEATARDTAERHALEEHSKLLAALMRGMTLKESEQRAQQITQAVVQRQQQQQSATGLVASGAGLAAAEAPSTQGGRQRQRSGSLTGDFDVEVDLEELADMAGSDSDYAADQVQSDSEWDDDGDLSEELDHDSDAVEQRQSQRQSERQRNHRQQRGAAEGRSLRSRRRSRRQERSGPLTRRGATGTPQQQRPTTRSTPQRQQRKRRRRGSSDGSIESDSGQEDEHEAEDVHDSARAQRRSSRRAAAAGVAAAAAAAAAADVDDEPAYCDEGADPSAAADPAAAAAGAGMDRQQTVDDDHPQQQRKRQKRQTDATAAAPAAGSSRRGRAFSCYSWLCESAHSPNTYVPQLGDAVVYLFEGHRKYLDARNDRLTERPWEVLKRPGAGQQQWWWWQQQQQQQPQQQDWQQWQQQQWPSIPQQQQQQQASTEAGYAIHPAAAAAGSSPGVVPSVTTSEPSKAVAVNASASTVLGSAPSCNLAAAAAGDQGQGGWPELGAVAAPYEMQPAEPCTIVGLNYVVQDEHTVAVLTLQLASPATPSPQPAAAAVAPAAAGSAGTAAGGHGSQLNAPAAAAAAPPGALDSTASVLAQNAVAFSAAPGVAYMFQVVVPHPSAGHADFVVLHSRFLESIVKTWQVGDRVQNYLLDKGQAEGGSWWLGTVVADARLNHPHAEVTADPYGCGGLWERYQIHWDRADPADDAAAAEAAGAATSEEAIAAEGVATAAAAAAAGAAEGENGVHDGGGAGGSADDHAWLSPWELYEGGLSTEAVLAKEHATTMTTEQVARLLHSVERMLHSSKYRVYRSAPPPDAEYGTDDGDQVYNRLIALPFGLQHIQERLESGYYRSMQAVLHDASLIATNAAAFNGQDSPLATRALELYQAIEKAAAEPEPAAAAAAVDEKQHRQRARNSRSDAGQVHGLLGAAVAAAAEGRDQQQQQRSRRTAAARADAFIADCHAADLSDPDSDQAAAAADTDPEADESLAAAAAAAGRHRPGRSKRGNKQQQRKARSRRRQTDSSTDYDSDSEAEKVQYRATPQRRSSRQQQQQHPQQRYREDYASDFDSQQEEEEQEEQPLQQRSWRSSRRQQQEVNEAAAAPGGLGPQDHEQQRQHADHSCQQRQQQQQQCVVQASLQAQSHYGAATAAAAAAQIPGVAAGDAGADGPHLTKGRIKLKLAKLQQKPGALTHFASLNGGGAAAAANGTHSGLPGLAADTVEHAMDNSLAHGWFSNLGNGSAIQQQLQDAAARSVGADAGGVVPAAEAEGFSQDWDAYASMGWDAAAAASAAQAAWYGQAAAADGASNVQQQWHWQQQMGFEALQQQQQQQDLGQEALATMIGQSAHEAVVAVDSNADSSRTRLRMRTRSTAS